ncbi:MAG: hypothetical protein J3T61_03200 [Candidatus Brocadiales bacterium]|nr:hypothetical protein [Candidatus Bathyanammoxibius sp.]
MEEKFGAAIKSRFAHKFRLGPLHRRKSSAELRPILEKLVGLWTLNPDVPISGGDSWTSFTRRVGKLLRFLEEQTNSTSSLLVSRLEKTTLHSLATKATQKPESVLVLLEPPKKSFARLRFPD